MGTFLQVLLLAVLQGVTEFLPVSSSGHLACLQHFMERWGAEPIQEPLMLGIVLHVASLFAILCYYWRPVLRMLRGKDWKLVKFIVVGTVPVGIIGILVKVFFDDYFETYLMGSVPFIGYMLIVTSGLLIAAQKVSQQDPHYMRERGWRKNLQTLGLWRALVIGTLQAVAILPGISRSGSTIAAGLFCGLKRNDAASFSFLLAIPAIGAAGLVECMKIVKEGTGNVPFLHLAVGFVVCFVVSLVALNILNKILKRRRIGYFAYYLIPMGMLMILLG